MKYLNKFVCAFNILEKMVVALPKKAQKLLELESMASNLSKINPTFAISANLGHLTATRTTFKSN